jgi:hypothetical protein
VAAGCGVAEGRGVSRDDREGVRQVWEEVWQSGGVDSREAWRRRGQGRSSDGARLGGNSGSLRMGEAHMSAQKRTARGRVTCSASPRVVDRSSSVFLVVEICLEP